MTKFTDQFGVFPTEEESRALNAAVTSANEALAKAGLGECLCILPGYPYGSAWLVTAPDTEPSGKARIAAREQADDPIAAVRRLLVRALHRYRDRD